MSKFIMPVMKPQTRGRKPQVFYFRDLVGQVFEVHSLRRFAELLERPLKSFYSLTSGRSATLHGLVFLPNLEEVPENVIVVTAETTKD